MKININNAIIYLWQNLKLDFNLILNEIIYYTLILEEDYESLPAMQNTQRERIIKRNVLSNIIKQRKLRNVIVDGIVLSDINYSKKFFHNNLYILINKALHKANPKYKTKLYQFIDKQIYLLFPDESVNKMFKKLSLYLKKWLVDESKKELSIIDNSIIRL